METNTENLEILYYRNKNENWIKKAQIFLNKLIINNNIKRSKIQFKPLEDAIVNRVIEKLASRSKVGIKKYNATIWDNTDENYILHLQEELLDGANYCEQIIRLGEFTTNIIKFIESEHNDQSLGTEIRKEYNKLIKKYGE